MDPACRNSPEHLGRMAAIPVASLPPVRCPRTLGSRFAAVQQGAHANDRSAPVPGLFRKPGLGEQEKATASNAGLVAESTGFRRFHYDRKEATVKPLDATHSACSAGLHRQAGMLLIPALVLFSLGGCSLAFVDGPRSTPSPSGNACTTSYTAPTLDLLGVPATFVLGFGFGGFERSLQAIGPDDDDTFGNLEKASLAASGALLVSGVYGLVQVGRCRGSRGGGGGPTLQAEPSRRPLPWHRATPSWSGRRASPRSRGA